MRCTIMIIINPDHHHHHHHYPTRCALTWEWQNVSWHKLMGQVLSDKKKRDVYDRFGEEGLKTNNGGGGGGGDQRLRHRHPHSHPHSWHVIHPTLHHNSHPQSHTVVTRSTGTRQKRSNNFSGLRTPSRASSTCLAWAPIHTRWSFLSSSAIFLHSYLFYLFLQVFMTTCIYSWPGFLQRWPHWWDGYGWSFRRVGSSSYCLLATVSMGTSIF